MFCWLRFKFNLYQMLWPFWSHLGFPLTPFSKKKTLRKSLQKKGTPPTWKSQAMESSRGSQRRRLLLFFIKPAASRARWIQFNSIQFELNSIQIQFKFNSIQIEHELEMVVWVGFEVEQSLKIDDWVWFQLEETRTDRNRESPNQFLSNFHKHVTKRII